MIKVWHSSVIKNW